MHLEKEVINYTKIEMDTNQKSVFSTDFIKLYSLVILTELEVLPGFISRVHNCNAIRYLNDTVFMADTENMEEHLAKVINIAITNDLLRSHHFCLRRWKGFLLSPGVFCPVNNIWWTLVIPGKNKSQNMDFKQIMPV